MRWNRCAVDKMKEIFCFSLRPLCVRFFPAEMCRVKIEKKIDAFWSSSWKFSCAQIFLFSSTSLPNAPFSHHYPTMLSWALWSLIQFHVGKLAKEIWRKKNFSTTNRFGILVAMASFCGDFKSHNSRTVEKDACEFMEHEIVQTLAMSYCWKLEVKSLIWRSAQICEVWKDGKFCHSIERVASKTLDILH